MEHRVFVRDQLEVLVPRLREEAGRIRPELGLELEVPDPAVPALGLAVGREVDEPVAGDALVPDGARQLAQLGRVVEVTGRLEEAERPARRHRRAAEELRHLAHHRRAGRGPIRKYQREPPDVGRVDDADPAVGSPHRELGVARVVEEQRVAAVRQEQRDAHVRAGAVSQMRVPELAAHPEPIQREAALAQTVEVLLAAEREARVDAAAAVRGPFRRHPALRGLAEEQRARGVEKGQPERRGGHLDPEIRRRHSYGLAVVHVDGGARPVARPDVREPWVRALGGELDPHDPRRADRDGHPGGALAEPQGRSVSLESWRGAAAGSSIRPPCSESFDCARLTGGVDSAGLTRSPRPLAPRPASRQRDRSHGSRRR